jgi:lysophospholipase L1-like esterase
MGLTLEMRAAFMACAAVVLTLSVGSSPAAAAEGAPMTGMVHDPCLPMPPGAADIEARREQDWAGLCHFQADDAAIMRGPPVRAVFLGDSITENWLRLDPSLFTGGVINRGISGQTSPQMLVRFYADVVALHPRVVHIMAGTNDLAGNTGPTSAMQYENNNRAICDLARANGIRVVLASIPPAAHFPWRPGLEPGPQIVELNRWLRDYAASRKMIFVDYTAVLADASGAMRADLSEDGVHPERAGYALMRPLAERAVAAAMAGK